MTTEKNLLREISKNPTDDEPRLVLADFYQENSNPRGDLIRTQCEMETLDWDDPRYIELEDIEEKLILKHRAKWLKELPKLKGIAWGSASGSLAEDVGYNSRNYFRRGFVELVAIQDFPSYKQNLSALKKYGLGGFVEFRDGNHRSYSLLQKQEYVRGTTFFQQPPNIDLLAKLKRPDIFQTLSAQESEIDGAMLSSLTQLDFPGLRSLDLCSNRVGAHLPKLFAWDSFKNLKWLCLGLNDIGGAPYTDNKSRVGAFSTSSLNNLFALDLWSTHLCAQDVKILAKSPAMNRLVSLSLARNKIKDAGVDGLLKGKSNSLRFLNLTDTDIGNKAVEQIAGSKKMSNLKRISLSRNKKISKVGLAAIAKSPILINLTHLNLPGIELDEAGANALIKSETLNSIRQLNIGDADLKPETIKKLQKRFPRAVIQKPYLEY